jgi:hypothetical protein
LIKRISHDTSIANIKQHFKSIYQGEINTIKETIILLTCSIDKIIIVNKATSEATSETTSETKTDERITALEKQNKSLISRIETLEKRDSEREKTYNKRFKTMNDSIQSLSDKYINSKETINRHENKMKEIYLKLSQSNVKLTQSMKENNVRFKKLSDLDSKKLSNIRDEVNNESKKEDVIEIKLREFEMTINNINVTLKSISKQNVEKDIILKNEIYKHIDSKVISSEVIDSKDIDTQDYDTKDLEISKDIDTKDFDSKDLDIYNKEIVGEINLLKEEVIKIRGEIDVIFRHNVNQPIKSEPIYPINPQVAQYPVQYSVNQQQQYPPIQYHVNQPPHYHVNQPPHY